MENGDRHGQHELGWATSKSKITLEQHWNGVSGQLDVEKAVGDSHVRPSQSCDLDIIISWDGDDGSESPYDWPASYIDTYAAFLILLTFLILLASSIIVAGVPALRAEFGNGTPVLSALSVSIYVLRDKPLGIGPILFALLSGIYGRVTVHHVCILGFVAFHVAWALAVLLLARETYVPVTLQRRVVRLCAQTGKPGLRRAFVAGLGPAARLRQGFVRPAKLLVPSPLAASSALCVAVVYGYPYLVFSSITQVFQESHGWAPNTVGFAFLGLGICSVVSIAAVSLTSGRQLALQAAAARRAESEVRVRLVPLGNTLLVAGFFAYGWTAQFRAY
ncbi:hypothetical protein GGR52DRAFT_585059 [Hypoxylon sp. FL1284]|nr:hypothetical protein GGR52DRAFT_585059 [Hypoxylon sp. FL1284]